MVKTLGYGSGSSPVGSMGRGGGYGKKDENGVEVVDLDLEGEDGDDPPSGLNRH